eukprot:scaffold12054_cov112-Skeletonema_dohrnii-CCMP3373.AAC.1
MDFGVVKSPSTRQISRASLRLQRMKRNECKATRANEISNLDPSLLHLCPVSSAEIVVRSVKHSHDLPEASAS